MDIKDIINRSMYRHYFSGSYRHEWFPLIYIDDPEAIGVFKYIDEVSHYIVRSDHKVEITNGRITITETHVLGKELKQPRTSTSGIIKTFESQEQRQKAIEIMNL